MYGLADYVCTTQSCGKWNTCLRVTIVGYGMVYICNMRGSCGCSLESVPLPPVKWLLY